MNYTIENAAVVDETEQVDVNGETATIIRQRLQVELVPAGHSGSAVRLSLPADEAALWTEGRAVSATFALEF